VTILEAECFSSVLLRTYSNLMLPLQEALGMGLLYHAYLSRDLISLPIYLSILQFRLRREPARMLVKGPPLEEVVGNFQESRVYRERSPVSEKKSALSGEKSLRGKSVICAPTGGRGEG
jgi:hypothetical protein